MIVAASLLKTGDAASSGRGCMKMLVNEEAAAKQTGKSYTAKVGAHGKDTEFASEGERACVLDIDEAAAAG